jgi:DNA-directed RNA polymerase specialized sigma24 family protein
LATIASHKLSDAARNERACGAELDQDLLVGRDPTPSDAAAVADTIEELLAGLPTAYGDVLQLRLEEHTVAEIARRLNLGRQPVRTMVKRLEERLERLNIRGRGD